MKIGKDDSIQTHLTIVYPVCLLMHVCLLLFFWNYHIDILVAINVGSVILYLTGTVLVRRISKHRLWVWLFIYEVLIHMVACNLILGWGMGFVLYALILLPYTFVKLHHGIDKKSFHKLCVTITFWVIVTYLSCTWKCEYKKIEELPDYIVSISFLVNLGICIYALVLVMMEYLDMVRSKELKLLDKNRELEHRAYYDVLTGALNRHGFFEKVTKILHQNRSEKFYMVCSDIKNFKFINDLYGDEIGNQVLTTMAQVVMNSLKEDMAFGRIGADKFAMLIPEREFDENIFLKLSNKMKELYSTRSYHFHMYLGVYRIDDIEENTNQMCDKAFIAIQKIKGDLHKQIAYYYDDIMNEELEKQTFLSGFEDALKKGQFQFYLQPQTDREGNMLGAEALVRWIHPVYGIVAPNRFVECFEESGIIYRLDRYIWEEAAKKLKEWKEQGRDQYYISINISAKDFCYIDVYKVLQEIVAFYQIDRDKLHIEITETAFAEQQEVVQIAIRNLHDAGYVIEIDDFGSGYSSLKFLKDVSAHVVKIDREFLKETSNMERGREILKSIIQLTKSIDMMVIAEGVETKEQLDMLVEMGCEWFQGYYFSKPLPVSEFEAIYYSD